MKVTSPATNSTFPVGSNVTLNATATDQNGVVSNVTFTANAQAVGADTASPYSTLWTNPAAGTYSVTATATDNQGESATSAPITVKISKALKAVKNGKGTASTLSSSLVVGNPNSANGPLSNNDQLETLVATIEQAYVDFTSEKEMFSPVAGSIDRYLYAALFLAKSSVSLSQQATPMSGISDRMNKINSYLTFCEDLMVDGVVSIKSVTSGNKVAARTDVAITQSDVLPLATNGVNLMQGSSASITSPISAPLTNAVDVAADGNTFELDGVSVSIGGEAVPMISVSPTAITFYVPFDLPGGLADVLITTRDGYITHMTAGVNGLNPLIVVSQGESNTSGAIFNALGLHRDGLSAYTSWWLGSDTQTRLSILASGLSTGLTNTDVSNDVFLGNGQLTANYADNNAVQVEARTVDGRVFMLPVEFAGANGALRGLDQVTVRLTSELAGAGDVQITVIAGGRRSNMSVVKIN